MAMDGVHVGERLVRRAGEVEAEFGLRAYDAVHLASADEVGEPDTVFVSADRQLLDAAHRLGFATISP